jgi:hypothetical protein
LCKVLKVKRRFASSIKTDSIQIVATDLFFYEEKNYVILVDSYSSWFDFKQVKSTNTNEVVKVIKHCFAVHGSPEELHSDNGPQFTSQ